MSTTDALAAAYRFVDAVERGDEAAARAAATARGFADPGDSAWRYWNHLRTQGMIGEPARRAFVQGDRAVVEVSVGWPQGPQPTVLDAESKRRMKLSHVVFLLLVAEDGVWRVEGAAKPRASAALFLAGVVSGVPSWSDLPFSEEGAAFAAAMIAAVGTGTTVVVDATVDADRFSQLGARVLRESIDAYAGAPEALGAVEAPGLGRLLVGLAWRVRPSNDRVEHWITLDRAGANGRPVLRWVNTHPSLEGLLAQSASATSRR